MWTKDNPYYSILKTCKTLTPPSSNKLTLHIVLDLGDSGIAYRPGDCLGILPQNPLEEVNSILKLVKAEEDTQITSPFTQEIISIKEFLLKKANISKPNRKILKL